MHILVAEDDPVSRELLRRILESEPKHTSAFAADGEEAWRLLSNPVKEFDCCILDILMPQLDGLELLGRMRGSERYKKIPVILCTAANDRATVQRAAGLNTAGYVVKPYTRSRVLDKLAEVDAALPRRPVAPASGESAAAAARQRFDIDGDTHRVLTHAVALTLREWAKELGQKPSAAALDRLLSRGAGLQGACLMIGEIASAQCVGAIKADFQSSTRSSVGELLEDLEREVDLMLNRAALFGAPAAPVSKQALKIPVAKLEVGQVTAAEIVSKDGEPLVPAGTAITPVILERLQHAEPGEIKEPVAVLPAGSAPPTKKPAPAPAGSPPASAPAPVGAAA